MQIHRLTATQLLVAVALAWLYATSAAADFDSKKGDWSLLSMDNQITGGKSYYAFTEGNRTLFTKLFTKGNQTLSLMCSSEKIKMYIIWREPVEFSKRYGLKVRVDNEAVETLRFVQRENKTYIEEIWQDSLRVFLDRMLDGSLVTFQTRDDNGDVYTAEFSLRGADAIISKVLDLDSACGKALSTGQ